MSSEMYCKKIIRYSLPVSCLLSAQSVFAKCGGVDYSWGADALALMHDYVVTMMLYVLYLTYAIAALVTIYASLQIFIKMNAGEEGIVKEILMVVGACMFMIGAFMLLVGTVTAFAQNAAGDYSAGTTALGTVTDEIAKYVPYVVKLCYAIAGIVAVVGAISVYIKMNNEEQDVKKSIMMIVGACIFLVAAAQALPLFFGISA